MKEREDEKSPIDYCDQLAHEYEERIKSEGLSPEEVVGEFLMASTRPYCRNLASESEFWSPEKVMTGSKEKGTREMIELIHGDTVGGLVFGAASMKIAVDNAIKLEGEFTLRAGNLYLLAYPSFRRHEGLKNREDEIGRKYGVWEVTFMTLSESQYNDIKDLFESKTENRP